MPPPHQYVIRFTLRQLLILGSILCILVIVAAGCFGVIHVVRGVFGTENVTVAESNSPDGLHRVVVIEERGPGKVTTHIQLFRSPPKGWTLRNEELVGNDSACRSNYSIIWTLDVHHAPTCVTVFGDFGSPPFPGDPIFTTPLP